MQSIKIIAVPPGEAPEWVRNEWIGVEIPLPMQGEEGMALGVLGGLPEASNLGGYQVETSVAIERLREKSPRAADWWDQSGVAQWADRLVFSRQVCKLVSDEQALAV